MFEPSVYQSNVFDFIENGEGNAVINAVAGSGKTTTLIQAISLIPADQKILFLAFNKDIATELSNRTTFYDNVSVSTVHSLGARTLRDMYNSKVDAGKYVKAMNNYLKSRPELLQHIPEAQDVKTFKANIRKLINLLRLNLCRSYDEARDICETHGLRLYGPEFHVVSTLIKWGRKIPGTIDFTDMLSLCNDLNLQPKQYDWVFIDECQDLSPAQRSLFLKAVKPGGRFLAVGDPRQAIYGFAGADAHSFDTLCNLPNTKVLPLSICYRCPTAVIDKAKTLVADIEAREGAPEGYFGDSSVSDVRDGDMVLCRINSPLVSLCLSYIAAGTKAYIKGRDIGASIIQLVEPMPATDIEEILMLADRALIKVQASIVKRVGCSVEYARESSEYSILADRVLCLKALSAMCETKDELISAVKDIFSDKSREGIALSSIHRSKGLEADRVFILAPEKLMLQRAMETEMGAQQEQNLVYVAWTRAKKHLGYITDFDSEK